jgi:hypothetical protein
MGEVLFVKGLVLVAKGFGLLRREVATLDFKPHGSLIAFVISGILRTEGAV